jgi:hypothetical protein
LKTAEGLSGAIVRPAAPGAATALPASNVPAISAAPAAGGPVGSTVTTLAVPQ